jgi:predicted transcriptional regulator
MLKRPVMAQRSREETISLILQSAEKGATQTTLMYETYLSHDALKEYLVLLLKKGLLQYLAGEIKFKTTSKGLKLLPSDIGVGDEGCSHQCKKCGVLYYCKQMNCQDPFHHAVCHRCSQFFNTHSITNEVHDVPDKLTLSLH